MKRTCSLVYLSMLLVGSCASPPAPVDLAPPAEAAEAKEPPTDTKPRATGVLSLDEATDAIAQKILHSPLGQQPTTIAVLTFSTNDATLGPLGSLLATRVSRKLIEGAQPNLTVVARRYTNQILQEQTFSMSTMSDERSSVEAGKLLSARLLVCGDITVFGQFYDVGVRVVDAESGAGRVAAGSRVARPSPLDDLVAQATAAAKKPKAADASPPPADRQLPADPNVASMLEEGDMLADSGLHSQAVEQYRKVVSLTKERGLSGARARALTRIGYYYQAVEKDEDRALASYNSAIEADPKYGVPYNNRGFIRWQRGETDTAEADFAKAVELAPYPKYVAAHVNLGILRAQQKRFDEARQLFDQAVSRSSRCARAYYNRGLLRKVQGDADGALADFTTAIEVDPKYWRAYKARGLLLSRDPGKKVEAVADLRKYIGSGALTAGEQARVEGLLDRLKGGE